MMRFVLAAAAATAIVMSAAQPVLAAEKAAVRDATAKCKAQVKEQAQFQEMSLLARHRAVKKCVNDVLAGR